MSFLRRLRGLAGIALVWSGAWMLAFIPLALYTSRHFVSGWLLVVIRETLLCGVWGAASGGMFGAILLTADRRRTLGELSSRRLALWGALGAMLAPLVLLANPHSGFANAGPLAIGASLVVSAGLGAAAASTTIQMARRAPPQLSSSDARCLTSPSLAE